MIIITGQTGTGKTSLALKLAKASNGELISVDSRQIYKEMDIGTGKVESSHDLEYRNDIYYLKGIPIYGINCINPDQIFSAGDFAEYGTTVLKDIQARGKTPILVGGTGFYIKSLIDPDDTVFIPQNNELREKYAISSLEELKKALHEIDNEKLISMNNSDGNNPRRLVRAIEVANWKKNNGKDRKNESKRNDSIKWIGLTAPKEYLESRVAKRVDQMIENNLEKEVSLLVNKYGWTAPGLQTIGYKEWKPYFEDGVPLESIKNAIVSSHLQYARKQMIYFKRFQEIDWQDISKLDPLG
jgi:tRNA dimethylallyltransferase